MASNYTENYGLCQWEATDQVLRTEFNEDNAKVEAALNGLAEQDAVLGKLVSKCGNCQIYTTSYTGDGGAGEEDPNTLTFPNKPVFVMISGRGMFGFTTYNADYMICIQAGSSTYCHVSWSSDGKTLSWYSQNAFPDPQLNGLGQAYYVNVWMIN